MNTKIGAFVKQADKLVWVETHTYDLIDTGCIFICYEEHETNKHIVYKLHKMFNDKFVWIGLWNTCSVTSVKVKNKFVSEFNTIQEAIQAKLDGQYIVKRMHLPGDFIKFLYSRGLNS